MLASKPDVNVVATDEYDDEEELLKIEQISNSRNRHAVSAEVYGDDSALKPRVEVIVKKSEKDHVRIREALEKSFLFNHLDDDIKELLVDVFEEVKISKGSKLIQQGDEGDALYLVESGSFDVYKTNDDGKDLLVNQMGPGSTVGELALLYSAPRAASVFAAQDSLVWKIDRQSFHYYTHLGSSKKRDQIVSSLAKVKLFEGLTDAQRLRLADSFKVQTYNVNDCVIQEGDNDSTFFILETGEAQAEKHGKPVHRYQPGDYFGELSLLRNQPRAASIRITQGPAICLAIDDTAFQRLLGSLEQLLEKNTKYYSDVPLDERI